MELKYFFDFQKCWDEILFEFKEDDNFDPELLDGIDDKRIANFIKNQIPIYLEECDISSDEHVIFCFSEEFQTANESNNQNDSICIYIEYDLDKECFTHYSREQS